MDREGPVIPEYERHKTVGKWTIHYKLWHKLIFERKISESLSETSSWKYRVDNSTGRKSFILMIKNSLPQRALGF